MEIVRSGEMLTEVREWIRFLCGRWTAFWSTLSWLTVAVVHLTQTIHEIGRAVNVNEELTFDEYQFRGLNASTVKTYRLALQQWHCRVQKQRECM